MLQNSSHKHNTFKTRPDIILSEGNVYTLGKQDIAKTVFDWKSWKWDKCAFDNMYIIEVYGWIDISNMEMKKFLLSPNNCTKTVMCSKYFHHFEIFEI